MRRFGQRRVSAEGQARAAMLQFRRGQTKAMHWKVLKLILDGIGWQVTETVGFAPVSLIGAAYGAERALAKALGIGDNDAWNFHASSAPMDPTRISVWMWHPIPVNESYKQMTVQPPTIYEHVFAPGPLPATPEVGRAYVTEVSPTKATKKEGQPVLQWSFRASYGAKAFKIIAADGADGIVYQYPGENQPRPGRIAEWMNEHGALPGVLAALGLSEHIPGASVSRSLQHTGTCGACEGNVKRDARGRMVHHGYQRPGFGYIVGDCLGVGTVPWELSPEGKKKLVGALVHLHLATQDSLRRLKSGEVTEFRDTDYRGKEKVVVKGDPMFPIRLHDAIRSMEAREKSLARDIEDEQKKLAAWTCQPLPDGVVEPCP